MKKLALFALLFLSACAHKQQAAVNSAFIAAQESKARAAIECSKSAEVSSCMLGLSAIYASGASSSSPALVPSDLQQWTGVLSVVAPVGGAIMQAKYGRDVAINASNNATAQQAQQWGAIGGIVRDTAVAQTTTASAAINGVASLGSVALTSMQLTASAGFNSNSQVVNGAAQALGLGFAIIPNLTPTVTNVAGANLVQGNSNDLSARRDTLTAGTELRYGSPGPFSEYDLVCTAAPAGSSGNGANGGLGGSSSQACQLVPR